MTSWQEFTDYIYSEIEFLPFFKNNKPNINSMLTLANESLLGLTVDYISFYNSNAETNVSIIEIPNMCKDIFRIFYKGEEVNYCNTHTFDLYKFSDELVYTKGDYKIIFNKPISFDVEDIEIIGKGTLSLYSKDINNTKIFELLPVQFHTMPAYFVLSRLFARARDYNMSQYYLQEYNMLRRDYEWAVANRRTIPATFEFMKYEERNTENVYKIYDKVSVEITTVPSLTPTEIDNRINNAINTYSQNVYTKEQVDTKDGSVLNQAKDYTYSKSSIDSKDTGNLAESKAYTDATLGTVESELDNIIGEE